MSTTESRLWFRCLSPRPDAAVRLLCFPHGGGSSAAFRSWHALLPPQVELYAVEYPGHADRVDEPPADDLDRLTDRIQQAVRPLLDRPFALYGHSLGALVAFGTAERLERQGYGPVRLTVSGMPAPQLVRPGTVHLGDDARLLAELERLGGVPPELRDHPDLLAMVLRAARADYRLAETYRHSPGTVLHTPLTTHRGLADGEMTAAEAAGWEQVAAGPVAHRTFEGDHFHPLTRPGPVVAALLAGLGAAAPAGTGAPG